MKKAFTLIELMIAISIIGILAAIALPVFQQDLTATKEAAAKDDLRILRTAIELYAARHNGVPPGYTNDDPSRPTTSSFVVYSQLVYVGHYLYKLPKNPLNGDIKISLVVQLPQNADGQSGWIYQPSTKTIKLNYPGTDTKGIQYYDY